MSYQVFARKYRPRTFKDVLGQDHVVQTLCNAIEQQRLAHAYLFVGPRGTGKTSTARIFAKALNCSDGPKVNFDPDEDICQEIAEGRSLEVLEIDGASNRGIDNIRDLRDSVQFAPARGQFRIIYIDEVHMLTKESFNALLKTLEEPPAHAKFIFATTEPHKILPTILSRCQRFDLRPIPADVIAKHLVSIAANEGVSLSDEAAMAVARVADGGMRDAQSMLDQLVSFCGTSIVEEHVNDIFGVTSRETVARALSYILDRQLPSLLHLVHEIAQTGADMGQLLNELMSALRELLVSKVSSHGSLVSVPEAWRNSLEELLTRTPSDKLIRLMDLLALAEERMRWSTNKRLHLEMGLIQSVHALSEANISDIVRALNGAPLPDTPIATTVLPAVSYPSISSADSTPTLSPTATTTAASIPVPTEPIAHIAAAQEPTPSIAQPVAPSIPEESPEEEDIPEDIEEELMESDTLSSAHDSSSESPADLSVQEVPTRVSQFEPIDDEPPSFTPAPSIIPVVERRQPLPMDASLWLRFLDLFEQRFPLNADIIKQARFDNCHMGEITLAIHPEDNMTRDALMNPNTQEDILSVVEELCLQRFRIRLTADANMAAPQAADISTRLPLPEPPPPVEKVVAPPVAEVDPAIEAAQKQREEEFYNDPLIEKALKEFHARIIT